MKNELRALWSAYGAFWFKRVDSNLFMLSWALGTLLAILMIPKIGFVIAIAAFLFLASGAVAATYSAVETPKGVKSPETVADLLAAVLIQEAGGEGEYGMRLVYDVICARASLSKKSKYEVVMETRQFSCLNTHEPRQIIRRSKRHKLWGAARRIVLLNMLQEPGKYPMTHFHSSSGTPSWAMGETPILTYKRHKFYRLPYP